ncbi:hypothetical protein [Fontibacter flavus]|uniref:Bacteriocin-type signal sequence-containing protein n=1 Tax=Fontibacter flavus TaxID=654838 RepID=A0ABV6FXJ5_9BACT
MEKFEELSFEEKFQVTGGEGGLAGLVSDIVHYFKCNCNWSWSWPKTDFANSATLGPKSFKAT